jgi:hypothetical protein
VKILVFFLLLLFPIIYVNIPSISIHSLSFSEKAKLNTHIFVCYANDNRLVLNKYAVEDSDLTCVGNNIWEGNLTMKELYARGFHLIQVVPGKKVIYYFERRRLQ